MAKAKSTRESQKPVNQPVRKKGLVAKRIYCPAIRIQYNDTIFFTSVVNTSVLVKICTVLKAEDDLDRGYQRHLSDRRLKKIAEYLAEAHVIPGALILCAKEDADLKYDKIKGMIGFLLKPGSFFIIDGQHRLYGAKKLIGQLDVPFVVNVFKKLTQQEQVQYFLDVNTNQIGVPKTLQLEVLKFINTADTKDKIRIKLFRLLNDRPESPLAGKMSATKSVVGKLSHVPFQKALDPALDLHPFASMPIEKQYLLLTNILNALDSVLSEIDQRGKLTNSAFFQAFFNAFSDILSRTRSQHGDYKEESFKITLAPLADIDWQLHSGTNKKAIQSLTQEIRDLIAQEDHVTDEML